MKKPILIYCYDAYCGWCYGFSNIINSIEKEYRHLIDIEAISGGMVLPQEPTPISITANYILNAIPSVEAYSGVKFGEDYLWHLKNPELSDWFPDSLMPSIATTIFKELIPEKQIEWVTDIQYALFYEGRDLTDEEAYRHLLEKYKINQEDFYAKLKNASYKQKAYEEFKICQQLNVTGYPALLLQISPHKIYAIANGYTEKAVITERISSILSENNLSQ